MLVFVVAELKSWSPPLLNSRLRRDFHEVPAAVNDKEEREKELACNKIKIGFWEL